MPHHPRQHQHHHQHQHQHQVATTLDKGKRILGIEITDHRLKLKHNKSHDKNNNVFFQFNHVV